MLVSILVAALKMSTAAPAGGGLQPQKADSRAISPLILTASNTPRPSSNSEANISFYLVNQVYQVLSKSPNALSIEDITRQLDGDIPIQDILTRHKNWFISTNIDGGVVWSAK